MTSGHTWALDGACIACGTHERTDAPPCDGTKRAARPSERADI